MSVLGLGLVVGVTLILVSVGSVLVAVAFFHSPHTVSFGTPGDTCTSDLLYIDSRTGEQLECVDRRFSPAIGGGSATPHTPHPWTEAEKHEILALAATLSGDGGLGDGERDEIQALANRIAAERGYNPAVDNTLESISRYGFVVGLVLLVVSGIGLMIALLFDLE